jgi:NADH:ubiquinone reductase (H+-translocating)
MPVNPRLNSNQTATSKIPQVVIVGCGFGGLSAAKRLRGKPVDIILVDRNNFTLFQPLLYQVATAALNPSEVAGPIRAIFRDQPNVMVVLGEVTAIDLAKKEITAQGETRSFDYLILAVGAVDNYFCNDQWRQHAPGLKTIESALAIRAKILLSFEAAELEGDPEARRAKLTFVIIGGGATGIEMAGAIKQLAVDIIARDFKFADLDSTQVVLIEAGERLLPGMHPESSARALMDLQELGVEVMLGRPVSEINGEGVRVGETFLRCANTIWAAGVSAHPMTHTLGVELGPGGRVPVQPDLSIKGFPYAFALGDVCCCIDPKTGRPLPGTAPVAVQMGRHVADLISAEVSGGSSARNWHFRYWNRGIMATIGRSRAVAEVMHLRFGGLFAWFLWLFIHIMFLIGFRSRLFTMMSWIQSYLFHKHGVRLIIGADKGFDLVRPGQRSEPEAQMCARSEERGSRGCSNPKFDQ